MLWVGIYNLQVNILKPTYFQKLLILSNHQSVSNSASVNLLIKRCIKWISKSACVWCLADDPGSTTTSKRNHPSHVRVLDGYLHSDRAAVIYIAQHGETESKGRDIKKLPRFFFSPHHFISAFPTSPSSPPTPNHQPSGLACHCWVSHSPSEGPQTPFFPLSLSYSFSLFFWGICHFIRACRSHQSANFIVQMGSGPGQLSGFSLARRGPGLAVPCAPVSARSHSWPVLVFGLPPSTQDQWLSGGQRPICEDTWLSTGGEISFTRAPVIWTVTNEASLVTSTDEQPQASLGSIALLLMTPTVARTQQLLPWYVSNACLITRKVLRPQTRQLLFF